MNFKKEKLTFEAIPTEDGPYCNGAGIGSHPMAWASSHYKPPLHATKHDPGPTASMDFSPSTCTGRQSSVHIPPSAVYRYVDYLCPGAVAVVAR
ncbi:unnamed protein product, partial [Iphiclides podalirius]